MKVKCINNAEAEDSLTINKIYNVTHENSSECLLNNDNGKVRIYFKNRFEVVE